MSEQTSYDTKDYGRVQYKASEIGKDGLVIATTELETVKGDFGDYYHLHGRVDGVMSTVVFSGRKLLDLIVENSDAILGKTIKITAKGKDVEREYQVAIL